MQNFVEAGPYIGKVIQVLGMNEKNNINSENIINFLKKMNIDVTKKYKENEIKLVIEMYNNVLNNISPESQNKNKFDLQTILSFLIESNISLNEETVLNECGIEYDEITILEEYFRLMGDSQFLDMIFKYNTFIN